ncbi:MAG: hypothetical protein O9293_07230 [Porphyrobacter sp.]|nr:hypothetical protein [Porphyrobacter sp.]
MLSTAITVLFTLTGMIAAASIAHSLRDARVLYLRLVREGEVMRAGLALQASAVEMSLRTSPRRIVATRRPAMLRQQPLPAFAAA